MGEFVKVADAAEIAEGELGAFDVAAVRVAVANVGGTFYAFGDACTHLQCSLAEGRARRNGRDLCLPRQPVRRHNR